MNGTCYQCLCFTSTLYAALNCFPNNTCQLFRTTPLYYYINGTLGARLYFPNKILPNASQCCMPNITFVLNKLRMANMTSQHVSNPRDAIIDNHGYLVTVERTTNYLDRFYPLNLTSLNHKPLSSSLSPYMTMNYLNGTYYIASYNNPMIAIESGNLTVLANISTSVNGIRGMIFLNSGATMVVTSCDDNTVAFLNRTSFSPIRYTFIFRQTINGSCPHGIWRVNDTFFYVTFYSSNLLYSFAATRNYTSWKETLVFPIATPGSSTGASRMTIDECGRIWFTYEQDTILIYNQQGILLGNWTISNSNIFDIKIMDNYLIYLTDSNLNRTMRVDPNIGC